MSEVVQAIFKLDAVHVTQAIIMEDVEEETMDAEEEIMDVEEEEMDVAVALAVEVEEDAVVVEVVEEDVVEDVDEKKKMIMEI